MYSLRSHWPYGTEGDVACKGDGPRAVLMLPGNNVEGTVWFERELSCCFSERRGGSRCEEVWVQFQEGLKTYHQ